MGIEVFRNWYLINKIKGFVLTIAFLSSAQSFANDSLTQEEAILKLNQVHSELKLKHGSFSEEYPEQLMTTMHLPSNAIVLELGGNIGRNTCVIAKLLDDSRNLVSLESDKKSARLLTVNRDLNNLKFHIEPSALSKRNLIQKGWDTIPSDVLLPGYFKVKTISFDALQKKYNMVFDTLVADCEGALYYILQDEPDLLKNINLIIVENDYWNKDKFEYTTDVYKINGFHLIYEKPYHQWPYFYQVWKRI
jgi:FkbM family methyltransferase